MKQTSTYLVALLGSVIFPICGLAQAPIPPKVALPEPVVPANPVPATGPQTAGAAPVPGQGIRLNFQGAALTDVLNYLSDAAGFVIVQEVPVTGTVNIVSRQTITAEEAVDLLNAVLIEKGYVALRSGRILKIVSRKDAQKRDLPVQIGSDPEKIPRKDEMVTQILPLRFGDAAKLIENLRPLLSESATMSANEGSNSILLTDTLTNVHRVARIIQAIDTSVEMISSIRVFALNHADAKQLATIITQVFASPTSAGSRGGDRRRDFFGGGDRGGGDRPQSQGPSEARIAATRVVAVADELSNTLVVSAPDQDMPKIKAIVDEMDTGVVALAETRIFRLQNADAVELADILTGLFADQTSNANNQGRGSRDDRRAFFGFGDGGRGGDRGQSATTPSTRALQQARVVAIGEPRTNSLLVTASRDSMLGIAEMIGRLDATDAKKQRVFVHSLEHADAENVAAVLRGMFGDSSGTTGRAGATTQSRLLERTTTGATADTPDIMNSGRGAGGGGR